MTSRVSASSSGFSVGRVLAMVERHLYVLRSSWPRMLELIYWPTVQMLTWGFLQSYIAEASGRIAMAAGAFIGSMLLWDILFRGGLGFSISFLEEVWAKNLGNLMMSPLRPRELVASLMTMSVIRLLIGMVPVTIMAIFFFGFNLWGLGFALAAFFANLILTSWSIALFTSGIILRQGAGAEGIAWSLAFILMPLCAVYYPVAVLPQWLQYLAWCLPPTYVFEGMRALVIDGVFRADLMIWALGINAVIFSIAVTSFLILMRTARTAGTLLQSSE